MSKQIKIFNSAVRQLEVTEAGKPCPPTGLIGKQCGLPGDEEDRGVRGEPAAEAVKKPSTTRLSKSAKKRSKKRASKSKKGVMNIAEFCYVLANNGGGGDAPAETAEERPIVNETAKPVPSTQQTTISSNNSYASIVSGKSSQDSFFMETDTAIEMEAKGVQAVFVTKTVAQQTGKSLSGKELKEQETQVEGSGVVAGKRDVAIQADLQESKMLMMNKRTLGTMTDADQKIETDEKAVGAKLCGCEDDNGKPHAVEFLGNQFRFESAVALAVSGLGISFFDCGEVDICQSENYESSEFEYMCPAPQL